MAVSSGTVELGTEAPDFTLSRAGGGEVSLTSLRGRPVVLAFLRGFL
jgi:peroxiredoxin Q/BCP